jgi:excisionase family DNA binding protein
MGGLTLFRTISGQTWSRKLGPEDFLTPMEAAVVLKVHRVTVYDWIKNKLLTAYESDDGLLLRWWDVWEFGRARGLL